MATSALRPHFKVGQKKIFLPNITVTLLRTSTLPATWAKFKVPITFNKLDIRDYLFHAYGVRVLRVRSYVEQQKVIMRGRRWRRPQAKKFMTVEMDRPFVWPEPPTDFSPWEKETYEEANEANSERGREMMRQSNRTTAPRSTNNKQQQGPRALSIADQAKMLLKGDVKWKPGWQAAEESR